MSGREAFEELCKALVHMENASRETDTERVENKIGRSLDFLFDAINAEIEEHGEHECDLTDYR